MAYGVIPSTQGYGYKILSGQAPIIPVIPQKEEDDKKQKKKSTASYTGVDMSIGNEKSKHKDLACKNPGGS